MAETRDISALKENPTPTAVRQLSSGELQCTYENGFIRYISAGATELIRSVYPAVRDRAWQTAPMRISEENITQLDDGFRISYHADFALNDIRYQADIGISSFKGESVVVSFEGIAGSDFLRNRIGLCALLPPAGLGGRPCVVGHPDGETTTINFPQTIHPVQPIMDIATLAFQPEGNYKIRMEFSGDVFETEDQRNWGDASFKIYSTPHDLPIPVQVQTGEKVSQEIRIFFERVGSPAVTRGASPSLAVFHAGQNSIPFPALGFACPSEKPAPDEASAKMLRRLNMDHCRLEIFLAGDWQKTFAAGVQTAVRLGTKLILAVYEEDGQDEKRFDAFLREVSLQPELIAGFLFFQGSRPLTTAAANPTWKARMKSRLPGVRFGSGTDSFFAHWNQQPSVPREAGDFISVPLSPQIHQPDNLTIIENLPAGADIIETIRRRSAGAVFISPVSLKPRYNPDSADDKGKPVRFPYASDPRQTSLLAAGWTAAALRYLGSAEKITLFELTGERGLMPLSAPAEGLAARRVFPVYLLLREIAAFRPRKLLLSRSTQPKTVDGVVMENTEGARLMVLYNFSPVPQSVQLRTESWKDLPLFGKTLSSGQLDEWLEDGEKFRSAPYKKIVLNEGNSYRLPPNVLLFISTLPDWVFR